MILYTQWQGQEQMQHRKQVLLKEKWIISRSEPRRTRRRLKGSREVTCESTYNWCLRWERLITRVIWYVSERCSVLQQCAIRHSQPGQTKIYKYHLRKTFCFFVFFGKHWQFKRGRLPGKLQRGEENCWNAWRNYYNTFQTPVVLAGRKPNVIIFAKSRLLF